METSALSHRISPVKALLETWHACKLEFYICYEKISSLQKKLKFKRCEGNLYWDPVYNKCISCDPPNIWDTTSNKCSRCPISFSEYSFNEYSGCYLIQTTTAGTWEQCNSFCSIKNGSLVNLETISKYNLVMSYLNTAPGYWFWVKIKIFKSLV